MAEQSPSSARDILGKLHTVAQLLREANHLGPEEQQIVAELVDGVAKALEAPETPLPELTRLAESTVHVLEAVHQRRDQGLLAAARLRVEESLDNAEARFPFLVGLVRHLMEVLAASGI
jgi:hypothetical protein